MILANLGSSSTFRAGSAHVKSFEETIFLMVFHEPLEFIN